MYVYIIECEDGSLYTGIAKVVIPEGSDIVFLTNVSYIQQNFDKEPTDKSANADLINDCISIKRKHNSVTVKIVPFHKYLLLPQTHELAHEAMMKHSRPTDDTQHHGAGGARSGKRS